MAEKIGMLEIFDSLGFRRPVTVMRVDSNVIVKVRTQQKGRYASFGVQVGYGSQKIRRMKWSALGHFAKHGVAVKRHLREFPVGCDALLPVGTELSVRHFMPGQYVDVTGIKCRTLSSVPTGSSASQPTGNSRKCRLTATPCFAK